jgi:hypothetical protein
VFAVDPIPLARTALYDVISDPPGAVQSGEVLFEAFCCEVLTA